MALRLITAPAVKPVTVSDMESHMRAVLTAETAIVEAYIAAITEKAEAYTRRALVSQTWELVLDGFPCEIRLPLSPLQSVTSIKYLDAAGVLQTLDPSMYVVDSASEPGRISPAYGTTWPVTLPVHGAVVIKFVCGYGAAASSVPASIKAWIMLNVASLYENRESIGDPRLSEIGMAESLLTPFRVVSW